MTITCHQSREWLSAFLDSELDETAEADVRQHLETCQACTMELERLKEQQASIQAYLASVDVPGGLEQQVMVQIQRIHATVQARRLVTMYSGFAVLGLLAILVFFMSPVGHFVHSLGMLAMAGLHGLLVMTSLATMMWILAVVVTSVITLVVCLVVMARLLNEREVAL